MAESDKGRTVRLGPSDPDSVRLSRLVRHLSDCPTFWSRPTFVRHSQHFPSRKRIKSIQITDVVAAPSKDVTRPLTALFEGIGDDCESAVADDGIDITVTLELNCYKATKGLPIMHTGEIVADPLVQES